MSPAALLSFPYPVWLPGYLGWKTLLIPRLLGELDDIPAQRPLRLSDHPTKFLRKTPTMDKSTHNTRIELVIADLAKQDAPNYMGTAKKYGLNYTTLWRRFLGE